MDRKAGIPESVRIAADIFFRFVLAAILPMGLLYVAVVLKDLIVSSNILIGVIGVIGIASIFWTNAVFSFETKKNTPK